jgi:hypothetical protein
MTMRLDLAHVSHLINIMSHTIALTSDFFGI